MSLYQYTLISHQYQRGVLRWIGTDRVETAVAPIMASSAISCVIPVFNNQDTLVELHRRLKQSIKGIAASDDEVEFIFIDDSSWMIHGVS